MMRLLIPIPLKPKPLTENGKINRHALSQLELENEALGLENDFVAPRTDAEALLTSIWAKVLKLERISIRDNFFDLGGHSLLAIQIISRIRDSFEIELSMRDLFEFPSIQALSQRLNTVCQQSLLLQIKRVTRSESLPLSFQQQGMWFLDQQAGQSAAYNTRRATL